MSFLEKIKEMGYELKDNEFNKIQIEKETKYSVFAVIFDMNDKYINACLQPKIIIHSDTDLTRLYNDWTLLKKDLRTFKELCNYDILIDTQETL